MLTDTTNRRGKCVSGIYPPYEYRCDVCNELKDASLFHRRIGWLNDRWIVCKVCAGKGKHCSRCGVYQGFSCFNKARGQTNRGGVAPYCKACRTVMRRESYDPDRQRHRNLRQLYNLTKEDYALMFLQQKGVCAVCKRPEVVHDRTGQRVKMLAVDHNHRTGAMRDLLCHHCNRLLGWIEKDRLLITALLAYLERHEQQEELR